MFIWKEIQKVIKTYNNYLLLGLNRVQSAKPKNPDRSVESTGTFMKTWSWAKLPPLPQPYALKSSQVITQKTAWNSRILRNIWKPEWIEAFSKENLEEVWLVSLSPEQ